MRCLWKTRGAALIGVCAVVICGHESLAQSASGIPQNAEEAIAPGPAAASTMSQKRPRVQARNHQPAAHKTRVEAAKKPGSGGSAGSSAAQPDSGPAMPAAQALSAAQTPVTITPPLGEFDPVVHARNAKIGVCMDNIVGQSSRVIDRPHQAASTWASSAPDQNVFQSIVSLSYANKQMPKAAAVILAAPIGATKCQGQSVQIFPTTRACSAVQASMIKIGKTIATLESLPLLQLQDGSRSLLVPSPGGGCVVVTVQLRQ
jgi:hypothetical protein